MIGQFPQDRGERCKCPACYAVCITDGSEVRVVFLQCSRPGVNFKSAFKCQRHQLGEIV